MLKKPLNIILLVIASIIVLLYIFDYNYLFRGLKLTYLKGESSSTIDDGKYFPYNTIEKGITKPWPLDSSYNKKQLSAELEKHLKETETVSFLIIKDGKLIQEHYWDSYDNNTESNTFSMAKTISTLLLGGAIDDGKIKNEHQAFSDFYKEFSNDPFGKNLSLENLAAMQAGLEWKEDYKSPFLPNAKAYYGNSVGKVVFNSKFKDKPGEKFEYQSGATQLLGYAVSKATDMPLASYASSKLWKPLGMEQHAKWTTDDLAMEKSFCCIQSNARDFAKIGQLFLNKGKVDGVPIINEYFIEKMITPTAQSNGTYGLGIWTNNDTKIKHYYLHGLYGQYVIVDPEHNMIVVRMGKKEAEEKDQKNRPKEVEFYLNESLKVLQDN